jgi:hypothetical protein
MNMVTSMNILVGFLILLTCFLMSCSMVNYCNDTLDNYDCLCPEDTVKTNICDDAVCYSCLSISPSCDKNKKTECEASGGRWMEGIGKEYNNKELVIKCLCEEKF